MTDGRQKSVYAIAGAAAAAGLLALGLQTWYGSRKRGLFRQVDPRVLELQMVQDLD